MNENDLEAPGFLFRGAEPTVVTFESINQQVRDLKELIEQGWTAVNNIGPSELRLMNKEVLEALADFQDKAVSIVADLVIARSMEDGRVLDIAGADEGGPEVRRQYCSICADEHPLVMEGVCSECGSVVGQKVADAQSREPEELGPIVEQSLACGCVLRIGVEEGLETLMSWSACKNHEGASSGSMLQEAHEQQPPEPEELGETVMCPHTFGGVPCTRTLHNVGLHTPAGYPVNASWTDKESD